METTLPSINLSFSPLTLFRAPVSRQGMFNNIVLSGVKVSRQHAAIIDTGDGFVIADLGSRTAGQALRDGVPPKQVWAAVWRALELPASER